MDNITLVIRGKEFTASKAKLSEYSDYFRAMFSGNYVENVQKQVTIDVLDPNIMGIILQYMRIGIIDLSEHSLATIKEIALTANFLQVTELIKQIEYTLDSQLSPSNWVETMAIAECATFPKLEHFAAAHGLLSFKRMKPEYIPTIQKLFWYLSHPYLDAETECEVFKFGHEWIMKNGGGGDALLLVLCCLDYKRLTFYDLQDMTGMLGNYANSLAEKVIECLREQSDEQDEFYTSYFTRRKSSICKKYTERVYREIVNLMKASIQRKFIHTPTIPMWIVKESKPEVIPHHLYTFTQEHAFEKWLEVAEKNLWGWSVIAWGLTKIILVCGEVGRGSGIFYKDIKVYDTLRQQWTQHGVELPPRRHAGLAVVEDELYIVGGVGGYRVVLDTAIVYDLNQRTYRKIAPLPDAIQNPAICAHGKVIYACGQKNIYRYEETGSSDRWTMVINTDLRASYMISFKGSIYCTQNYFSHLYRFKPGEDDKLEMVSQFSSPPAVLVHMRDRMMVFTRTMCGHADIMAVEEYDETHDFELKPKVLWLQTFSEVKINDVAGSALVVTSLPPIHVEISQTHKRYLERFSE
ncbi:kelch-like protein 25 isoform X2 [Epargyreus clarus]|uniref:kelch-like protein 25 isoform X2 n=1 Tax=Epargyreus clarus TaxID=520877 RepID=UPI003C30C5D1